jgi:hypothetical protein
MSRLKQRVDLSASLIASANLRFFSSSGVSAGVGVSSL